MWYKNGTVFNSQQAIRLDNPNTSLPGFMSDAFIESLGYLSVYRPSVPDCTEVQYAVENGIEMVEGIPTIKFNIVDKFSDIPEYTDPNGVVQPAITKAEQEIKYYNDKAKAELKAVKDMFVNAIQNMLDSKAKEKGYDSIVSVCSYAGYENTFKAEGEAYGIWRALCWQTGYLILANVEVGTRQMPTVEEVLSELPELVLP